MPKTKLKIADGVNGLFTKAMRRRRGSAAKSESYIMLT